MQRKLLIVEDEAPIRDGLTIAFRQHGFEIESAEDGNTGLELALSKDYDLILLDIMLPGLDGYSICQHIKEANGSQPVIMLTAKSSEEDIIQGLSLGADDYVSKPFSVKELLLRAEAVLRRNTPRERQNNMLVFGHVALDLKNLEGEISDESGAKGKVLFTRKEMEVVEFLYIHRHRPVSREELLEEVWNYKSASRLETRTVDIHIAKIRKKIERNSSDPEFLLTVRGKGYRLKV
jgi:two-component system response regulator RegX3